MGYRPLPVGVEDFEKLITRGYYYVDKTLLIRELLDKKGDVNLFTRPRRFGKTLNMSMLRYFFEDARDEKGNRKDHTKLFEGLRIAGEGEKYLAHMGRYPVISLSLKSGKQPDFQMAYRMLVRQIAEEYERHSFILESDCLTGRKERYLNIMQERGSREDYNDALLFLSRCLERYFGKRVIVLIDEYDVPLENAFFNGFYEEMTAFIRSLFESVLKTNSSLEFAILTGCLRISKESIFTGMNNFNIFSILNKSYDEYFGFTDDEVKDLCSALGLSHKYEDVKAWYDGYLFGDANVYNPWSVIRFMEDLQTDENTLPAAYWANTSSNSIVRNLIEGADEETKAEIESLIEGGVIEKPVHEDITYDEVYDTMDHLWNFMFFTGYFRKVREYVDEKTNIRMMVLNIPNEEVRVIFRMKVRSWFREKIQKKDLSSLYTALVKQDADTFEKMLNELLLETISFNDAYENFYHGFVTGVLAGLKGYVVKSNREGGNGRSDLFIKPVTRRKKAFVIELKVADRMQELEEKAEEALQQIEDRRYERELNDDGYLSVGKVGISFFRKDCVVRMEG